MVTSSNSYKRHSIAETFASITRREDPWFALGCFLHDWWCYAVDARTDLIAEPPMLGTTLEEKRWRAFCAATIEELCVRTGFPCPAWANRPDSILEQPWFYYPQPSQRDWLLSTTPETFQRHNVFVGEAVLDNKYELQQQFGSKSKWTVWSDEELQGLVPSSEEISASKKCNW